MAAGGRISGFLCRRGCSGVPSTLWRLEVAPGCVFFALRIRVGLGMTRILYSVSGIPVGFASFVEDHPLFTLMQPRAHGCGRSVMMKQPPGPDQKKERTMQPLCGAAGRST